MPDLSHYLEVAGVDPGDRECRLERGQFNDVVIVGDEMALRFPRTDEARVQLPRITELLRSLEVGVEIPRPISVNYSGPVFAVLSYVSGTPFRPEWAVPVQELRGLLERMARVVPPAGLAPAPDWARFAADVRAHLCPLMSAAGRDRAGAELAGLGRVRPGRATLVHGDLGGGNLRFVDGHLVGVLDWDEAHLGDSAADLASIAVTVGWAAAAEIAPDLVPAARAYAGTFALQQALPAWRTGDRENLADGLAGYLD